MQLLPLVGFYWKHSQDIEALVSKGDSGSSHIVVDLAAALAPVLKKQWPQLNNNNLLDDAVATLKEVLAPPTPTVPPDQQGSGST